MYIAKFIKETDTEEINCMSIALGKLQITFALAESNWETKGKKRIIPIYANKKGVFLFKLAVTFKIKDS